MTQTWPNGYDEESLQINFSQMSMKQLCEFLQSLQANPRVFVKDLDITKGSVAKKINASLTIATLKPVVEKQAIRGN
jgi:type II secretory pathway component PulM